MPSAARSGLGRYRRRICSSSGPLTARRPRDENASVMKISGVASMHAPPGRVWAALNDPAVLVATIPGCERLEAAGPDSYRFTVAAGVASIHGIYTREVSLSQQQRPSSFVLTA